MANKKTLKTIKKKETKKLVNFKALPTDIDKIKKKADKYAGGNVSEYIRYAALNFKPTKKDLA